MKMNIIQNNGISCVEIESMEKVITDVQSVIDLLVTANYEAGTKNIIIDKKLINEDFFFSVRDLRERCCKNSLITEVG